MAFSSALSSGSARGCGIDPWKKGLAGGPLSDPIRAELMHYQKIHSDPVNSPKLTPEMDRITMDAFMMQRYGLAVKPSALYLPRAPAILSPLVPMLYRLIAGVEAS